MIMIDNSTKLGFEVQSSHTLYVIILNINN